VALSESRPFAFKVTNTLDDSSYLFALESKSEFFAWMDLLNVNLTEEAPAQVPAPATLPTVTQQTRVPDAPKTPAPKYADAKVVAPPGKQSPSPQKSPGRQFLAAPLWKMKKGVITGATWKKKWVYADRDKLMHWKADSKPTSSADLPSQGFILYRCVIEPSATRKFAFKITDTTSNIKSVFALDTADDYRKWMEFLAQEHPDPNTARAMRQQQGDQGEDEDEVSLYSDFDPQEADTIADFFDRNNISKVWVWSYLHGSKFHALLFLMPETNAFRLCDLSLVCMCMCTCVWFRTPATLKSMSAFCAAC